MGDDQASMTVAELADHFPCEFTRPCDHCGELKRLVFSRRNTLQNWIIFLQGELDIPYYCRACSDTLADDDDDAAPEETAEVPE